MSAAEKRLAQSNPTPERPRVRLGDLWIRTKDRQLVPLVPNAVQSRYLGQIEYAEGQPVRKLREDVLKARQQGFSTLILALIFLDTINTPHTQSIVIAHDTDSTERLFRIIHRYYDHLPPALKRPTLYSSRRELVFADIDSGIYVGTAGSASVGRGGTINNVHASEFAFWPDSDAILAGLMQAVPADGNVWLETTANGLNAYYERYNEDRDGSGAYQARFFPWHEHAEYRLQPGIPPEEWTDEEREQASLYGLDADQVAWRRAKKRELRGLFAQEYPSNPDEAFVSSAGGAFFEVAIPWIRKRLDELQHVEPFERSIPGDGEGLRGTLEVYFPPVEYGCDVCEGFGYVGPGRVCKRCDGRGRVRAEYVVGADVAKGVIKGASGASDRDYCTMDVVRRDTLQHVASYWAREGQTPEAFAADLVRVATHYHRALIICESNNHGRSTLNELARHLRYPNLYGRPKQATAAKAGYVVRRPEEEDWGFETTVATKPLADGYLRSLLEDAAKGTGPFQLNGARAARELLHYGHLAGGKAGALAGHDDHVRSLALCGVVLCEDPRLVPKRLEPAASHATAGKDAAPLAVAAAGRKPGALVPVEPHAFASRRR